MSEEHELAEERAAPETDARRAAMRYALSSLAMEDLHIDADARQEFEAYVDGSIDIDELRRRLRPSLASVAAPRSR